MRLCTATRASPVQCQPWTTATWLCAAQRGGIRHRLGAPLHRTPGARLRAGGHRARGPTRRAGPPDRIPSCSTSWESAGSWPVSSSPPGPITDPSDPRPPSQSSAVQRPSRHPQGLSPAPTEQIGRPTAQPGTPHDVLVRMRQDLATKAYFQRRLAEGKTVRDIKRCLKRYVARQLSRRLEVLPRLLDGT
jgi:hypothetical protein